MHDGRCGNLPVPRSSFVGRVQEREELRRLILDDAAPLVTLLGTGGVGKTRLAIEVARELEPHFADGVCLIRLDKVTEVDRLPLVIASAVGAHDLFTGGLEEAILDRLRSKQALLLVDNVEHLLSGVGIVDRIMTSCPAVQVLATSRHALDLDAEHLFPVSPLPYPETDDPLSAEALGKLDAITLFVQRARAADPRFTLTDENADAVRELAVRLSGLPLAVELAASRLRTFSPREMLAQLAAHRDLLSTHRTIGPARHRSMDDAIAWSYRLLDPDVQRLFRLLSVFVGGFDADTAAYVVSEDLISDVSDPRAISTVVALSTLVDHGLLERAKQVEDVARFRMLEPVRQFALAEANRSGEYVEARNRHASQFVNLFALHLDDGILRLESGPTQLLMAELPNARVALDWLLQRPGDRRGPTFAATLCHLWYWSGSWTEARGWLKRALMPDLDFSSATRSRLFYWAAHFAGHQCDRTEALFVCQQHLDLAEIVDSDEIRQAAHVAFAKVHAVFGDFARARPHAEEAVEIAQRLHSKAGVVIAGSLLGIVLSATSHWDEARAQFHSVMSRCELPADAERYADALNGLGWIDRACGRLDEARRHFQDAVRLSESLEDWYGLSVYLGNLGRVIVDQRDPRSAAKCYRDAMVHLQRRGVAFLVPPTIGGIAECLLQIGREEQATELLGSVAAFGERAGLNLPVVVQRDIDHTADQCRHHLGSRRFSVAWDAGWRWSLHDLIDRAIALASALAEGDSHASEPAETRPHGGSQGLSAREIDVLRLLARHMTDKEIADELFISIRTVQRHNANIFSKLGVASRREAAAAARELGLS